MNPLLSVVLLYFGVILGIEASRSSYSVTDCTCPEGSMVFDIYTDTSKPGSFQTKCIQGSFALIPTAHPVGDGTFACYALCDEPCITPTVTCLKIPTMTHDKPGKCPSYDIQADPGTYVSHECNDDRDCPAQERCCQHAPSGFRRCANPVEAGKTKCGSCATIPSVQRVIDPRFYDRACSRDDQCTGSYKCCPFAARLGTFHKCYHANPESSFELS